MTNRLFFIGRNTSGEFGLNHTNSIWKLTECPNKSIKKVTAGYKFSIFSDDIFEDLWASGNNGSGQLAVDNRSAKLKKCRSIYFFYNNRITIRKICTNVSHGKCTFFISGKGELYASGRVNQQNQYEPVHIKELENVIHVQSSDDCLLALCSPIPLYTTVIMTNWSRVYSIPSDIIDLLIKFLKLYRTNVVFSTTKRPQSGHLIDQKFNKNNNGWNEIQSFTEQNVNIIKIQTGLEHSLFLDDTGIVWSCGINNDGNLGLGSDVRDEIVIYGPKKIKYFIKNDIKIIDIKCGSNFNLALDSNGKVYSWGTNFKGQCGHNISIGGINVFYEPKCIKGLMDYVVDDIKCGYAHCCARTVCGKWFMWGCNDNNQCIAFNDGREERLSRVDEMIKDKTGTACIVDIVPGLYNTYIIVSNE